MRIINLMAVTEFGNNNLRARKPLRRWIDIVYAADWKSFTEVKSSFNSADYVEGYVIFDSAGKHYRLISTIRYQDSLVIVENIFTHREYDKWWP